MNIRLASFFLAAGAGVLSYVVVLMGSVLPRFFEITYQLKAGEGVGFMQIPTRFAIEYSWVFVFVLILIFLLARLLLSRDPDQLLRVTVAAASLQALVLWAAFFCYCYDCFCGPMCLHHGPEFDVMEFSGFGAGIFPVSLVMIVIPLAGSLFWRPQHSGMAEPDVPPNDGQALPPADSGTIGSASMS